MDSLHQQKYKDELPLNTISRIRNILTSLGILVVETGWQNSAEEFYSVNLAIENTAIKSNGKGTTNEYALASAYGELLERLQNQAPFRLSIDLSKENLEYMGFFYTPDEKCLSIDDILNSDEDWIKTQLSHIKPHIDKRWLLNKWQDVSYENTPCDFVTIPYLNIRNNKLSYIPVKMASKMYMSNGMCAGNTAPEALVQGICEILERHINKEIIMKKITPPTIPKDYTKKYPKIYSMINRIERNGNYSIILKDCSLNKGYPAVGVIFINRDDQSYFIKFGSHPIFEIAVERTLTELLQGQNIKNMIGLKEFSYKATIDNEHDNLINILVNGSGIYPIEFFSNNFSYEFKEFDNSVKSSNQEMLKFVIEFLKRKNFDIFIRDVSYLDFQAFHIIIPGLSEIEEIDNITAIERYSLYNRVKKNIRNLKHCSKESIDEIFGFFETAKYNMTASIPQFLNLKTKNVFPWYYTNIDLFIGALHYYIGDFKKSYRDFEKFIKHLKLRRYKNKVEMTFYKCLRDYIGTLIDGLNREESIDALKQFYSMNIINGVINDVENCEIIFEKYGQFKCWNCSECRLKNHCLHHVTEGIYKTLKERYASSSIDQNNLKKILNI